MPVLSCDSAGVGEFDEKKEAIGTPERLAAGLLTQ